MEPDGRDAPDRALDATDRGRSRGREARAPGIRGRPSARAGAAARRPAPVAARRPAARRDRAALHPPGRGARGRLGGPDDRHDRHRVGQVTVLQPAGARRVVQRRQGARAVPVPHEGAGPGPGARDPCARARQGRPAGDLRRRHPARGAHRDPPQGEPRPDQPRHAPRRDPAQPPDVGGLLREPRGRRGGRGARLPRRVRLARGQRAAQTAPDRSGVRHVAADPVRVRHDRQPGRARGAADRPRGHRPGRPRRLSPCPPAHRDVEPAGDRRGAAAAPQRAGRGRRRALRPRHGRRALHLLHQVAQGGRACCKARLRSPRRRGAGARRHGRRPTAPATRPSSAASSSTG